MDASKSAFDDPEFPGKSEPSGSDPSSATAIFGTVSAKPPSRQDDDLLRSLMGGQSTPTLAAEPEKPASPDTSQTQPSTPVIPPRTATPAASTAGPGEFTEIFQRLEKQGTPPSQPPLNPTAPNQTPAPSSPKPSDDLAGVFKQVIVEKTALVSPLPSPPPASKPGEFTQLLQILSNSAQQPEPQAPAPPPAPAAPGAFTQMFNAVSDKPTEPSQTAVFSRSEPPPPAAPPSSETAAPGEFTRMFQSAPSRPSTPPAAPAQPAVGPEPFTQMFSAQPIESTPAEDPLKSLKPEPAPPVNTFQSPGTAARSNEAVPAAQGGFTQLLQALNKEEPARPSEPVMAPPPLQPAPSTPAVGGFTQLLQTLSAESTPKQTPPTPFTPPAQSAPSPPPSSSGPGEFTRIISGSQLRDVQSQSPTPAVSPAPQAARPVAPPLQFPQAPAFPSTPQMHAAQGPSTPAPAMPHFQPPAFQFPPAPAPPAPPPPATSKLQQYLPLILILNIFVLLVIVLILIFVLRHH